MSTSYQSVDRNHHLRNQGHASYLLVAEMLFHLRRASVPACGFLMFVVQLIYMRTYFALIASLIKKLAFRVAIERSYSPISGALVIFIVLQNQKAFWRERPMSYLWTQKHDTKSPMGIELSIFGCQILCFIYLM